MRRLHMCFFGLAHGAHLDAFYQVARWMESLYIDKDFVKNQHLQIILALNLTTKTVMVF